jgi:hypothetical protein
MRFVPLFIVLGLASCGDRTSVGPAVDSGISSDDSSGGETGSPVEAGSSLPAPGTSACNTQPQGTCALCSDSKWHCGSAGSAYEQCSSGQNVCNADGQPCVNCKSDGTGTMGIKCLNPGGDNNIEGTAVGVTCSQ